MMFGMHYFDPDDFFRKVSSLLEAGGVFATVNDYCYETHACAMHLPMDAPWLHARLTMDDLFRYYEEVRPDIADMAKKAIYFPIIHLTIKDYVNSAKNHGLDIISFKRNINTQQVKKTLYSDPFLRDYFLVSVLPDARVINEHAIADDFFTNHLAMVFRKTG